MLWQIEIRDGTGVDRGPDVLGSDVDRVFSRVDEARDTLDAAFGRVDRAAFDGRIAQVPRAVLQEFVTWCADAHCLQDLLPQVRRVLPGVKIQVLLRIRGGLIVDYGDQRYEYRNLFDLTWPIMGLPVVAPPAGRDEIRRAIAQWQHDHPPREPLVEDPELGRRLRAYCAATPVPFETAGALVAHGVATPETFL